MVKKVIFSVLFIIFSLCLCTFAEPLPASQKLALLDKAEHSPEEFLLILKAIRRYNPGYSFSQIADTIEASHSRIKEDDPEITIYDVAQGIRRFSSDTLGIRLQVLAASYIKART